MNSAKKPFIFNLLMVIILFMTSYSEDIFYFPVDGKSVADISSSFGPRNKDEYLRDYPDPNYDYDFHCALDIAALQGTDVLAVLGGEVTEGNTNSDYLIIKHYKESGSYFWVMYQHIDPIVSQGKTVVAGEKIGDIDEKDHLDIRYYPYGEPEPLDINTYHPYEILLGMDLSETPIIIDINESTISDHYGLWIYSDDGTLHNNPAGAKYFTFGVRVPRVECDLQCVEIYLSATDNEANTYDHKQLLNTSYPQANWANFIDYCPYIDEYDIDGDGDDEELVRYNCGDRTDDDDDHGHNSTSVGIYPKALSTSDTYHTVYFRWYINESLWNSLGYDRVKLQVYAYDWKGNTNDFDNLQFQLCNNCHPPANAPGPPTLISANYFQNSRSIKLEYERDWSSPFDPDYFKIYRCLSSETMSDNDVIGICSHPTEYYDDSAELQPGVSYKYAVAGVNYAGEGYNSNMLSEIYGELLPTTISSNTQLDGVYYSDGTIISNGYTVTIAPGTIIKVNVGKSIVINGTVNAQGTSPNPIKFQSDAGFFPLDIRNGSQFSYCLFDGFGYLYIRNQPSTFSYCVFRGMAVRTDNNGTFDLSNCIVENGFCGMGITTGTAGISYLTNCTIRNNTSWGIKTSYDGRVVLDETEVYDNGDGIVVGYHGI
ncbi:MAG: peptidoglycan DD-metalloendopeptidase family protein, partial [Candidatus Marinimicrobia bacterium]|nr:peptidoglycan DD-metalloendopeptidase family protein [Candidatus Neomarinimicrobiota bacterium]